MMHYLKGLLIASLLTLAMTAQALAYEARMYGMTGLLGRALNFSIGVDTAMDEVRAKYPTVKTYGFRHLDKWQVRDSAIANYKRDGLPVILIGHSLGADATFWVAHQLQAAKVPVAAIFSYDPTPFTACAPDNVQVVISWRNTYPAQLGAGVAHWCNPRGKGDRMALYALADFHTNIDDRADVHRTTVQHTGEVVQMFREMQAGKVTNGRK